MRPTHERVRELLHYEPETGVFTRLVRTANRTQIGDVAGGLTSTGYWRLRVDGESYRAHILAWFYVTGQWPTYEVDHIDGNPLNNAFVNLRDEPRSVNQHNIVAPQKNNRVGDLGVTRASRNRFRADIRVNRKRHYLGCFDTIEEASAAYWAAKAELHGEETYQVRLEREMEVNPA